MVTVFTICNKTTITMTCHHFQKMTHVIFITAWDVLAWS